MIYTIVGGILLVAFIAKSGVFRLSNLQFGTKGVKSREEGYADLFSGARENVGEISTEKSIAKRQKEYQTMVDSFYDLVTDFYEFGWGQSFHFAPRFKGESFKASLARLEQYTAYKIKMNENTHCLDVGCGVGGPMRTMARFSRSKIEGVTINEYQVKVGNRYNEEAGLGKTCHITQGDFMNLPFESNSYDCAYAFESTCHAPNKQKCFAEVYRVLKPGGYFVTHEWLMLDKYDSNNKEHVRIKEGIEVGNGLPTLETPESAVNAMKGAGFEIVEHYDSNRGSHNSNEIPWYATLNGSWSFSGLRMTYAGRRLTHYTVTLLEMLKIAPAGTTKVSKMLNQTAIDLVDAGKLEIMTPSYFILVRKPLE